MALKLMIVDDSNIIRSRINRTLTQHNMIVVATAADGEDAVRQFKASMPDVVTMDLTMPRMDGDEVLHEIRRLAPKVPVILMSGYAEGQVLADLADKELAGFLPKPCSVKEAQAAVRKALGIAEAGA